MELNNIIRWIIDTLDPNQLDVQMARWRIALEEQVVLLDLKNKMFDEHLAEAKELWETTNEWLIAVDDKYDEVEHISAQLDDPTDPKWIALCRKRYDELDEMRIKFVFTQERIAATKKQLIQLRNEILTPLEQDIENLFNLAVSISLTYQYLSARK